ncbi:MAG TPA: hypothetical protein VL326_27990 [Kofleriaceae bacterium]|nr:hypothetical protein [Kofleriaceae bacterium]
MAETDSYKLTGDYSKPTLDCDLVMKGGITSGVVYPLAICKIAEKYRLHSIGGASAGAIAAAAAAAAEYARRNGRLDGYTRLQGLPDELCAHVPSGTSRLLSVFQPSKTTRTAFDLVLIGIRPGGVPAKILPFLSLVVRRRPVWPVLGLLAALLMLHGIGDPLHGVAVALGALAVVATGLLAGAIALALGVERSIAQNRGGICSGNALDARPGEPALCEWLADLFDRIADKRVGDDPDKKRVSGAPTQDPQEKSAEPLTFGDLDHDMVDKKIVLQMITTSLTHGRPYRLPFAEDAGFFMARRDLYALFPERIAKFIEKKGREFFATAPSEVQETFRANMNRVDPEHGEKNQLIPLPPANDLPVVFGVRMSLSFPVLLSAVPLYAVDWTTVRHPNLNKEQTTRPSAELPPIGPLTLSRCWFSDGGICSNLPIHFFDALLPSKPTFALNLREEHPRYPVWLEESGEEGSELRNVWVPESANAGYAESWRYDERVKQQGTKAQDVPPLDAGEELGVPSLIVSMVDTMQNWNDNMLAKAPGYRDRIIHISHRNDEGGLNLDMPKPRIERLSKRGAAAGYKLARRFDRDDPNETGWKNHLWVRYRSALAMLEDLLWTAQKRYFIDDSGKKTLGDLLGQQPSYPLSPADTLAAEQTNNALGSFEGFGPESRYVKNAPPPPSDLRPRPRGG